MDLKWNSTLFKNRGNWHFLLVFRHLKNKLTFVFYTKHHNALKNECRREWFLFFLSFAIFRRSKKCSILAFSQYVVILRGQKKENVLILILGVILIFIFLWKIGISRMRIKNECTVWILYRSYSSVHYMPDWMTML